ncbi:PCYCGC motif-containing (lipo)protein [Shimazuella kribbensis]|uniref:PCYCGC motif-containing (lipo)protein n=1 Tax=Shimazuella kribbensis TaxID=139808 RepID=UPI003CCB9DF2
MVAIVTGLFIIMLMGCQAPEKEKKPHHESSHGDVQETTNGATILPSFVKELDPQIGQVYQLTAQNHQLLQSIPCYCGCGESVGHQNNLDCFVKEIKKNGQVTWDSHGTTCGTCLEIAAESVYLQKQGKTTKEIRKYIDDKYNEGYAKPTPTPMPL